MAEEDPWADMFAKASALDTGQPTTSNGASPTSNSIQEIAVLSKKKSKSERRKKRKRSEESATRFQQYLRDRISCPDDKRLPRGCKLGRSFAELSCPGWQPDSSHELCGNCKSSSVYHELLLDNTCACDKDAASEVCHMWVSSKIRRGKASLLANIPASERSIVESKLDRLVESVETAMKKGSSSIADGHEDRMIAIIISCDNLYYRLYYLQITGGMTPPNSKKEPDTVFLPHPHQYFGPQLTIDLGSARAAAASLKTYFFDCDDNSKHHFDFLSCLLKQLDSTVTRASCAKGCHPLLHIHKMRMLETIAVFAGTWWIKDRNMHQWIDLVHENQRNKDPHETVAPYLLSQWRDSVRDFMCNLYAYACLPCSAIQGICNSVASTGSDRVVEVGCGTGYLSQVLNRVGLEVISFDLSPTGNGKSNEYHGTTPPFCSVRVGSNVPAKYAAQSTLMLCYPPPNDLMASRALEHFLENGGSSIVYVGEFFGLTAEETFQSLLVDSFRCVFRQASAHWGTDASFVTIWEKKRHDEDKLFNSLLLPCSYCANQESLKRCRHLRSIAYCSAECCRKDSKRRSAVLSCYAVPPPLHGSDGSFHDKFHFEAIGF